MLKYPREEISYKKFYKKLSLNKQLGIEWPSVERESDRGERESDREKRESDRGSDRESAGKQLQETSPISEAPPLPPPPFIVSYPKCLEINKHRCFDEFDLQKSQELKISPIFLFSVLEGLDSVYDRLVKRRLDELEPDGSCRGDCRVCRGDCRVCGICNWGERDGEEQEDNKENDKESDNNSTSNNNSPLVTCTGCGITVHAECYGVPTVPKFWFCSPCLFQNFNPRCFLCEGEGESDSEGSEEWKESEEWKGSETGNGKESDEEERESEGRESENRKESANKESVCEEERETGNDPCNCTDSPLNHSPCHSPLNHSPCHSPLNHSPCHSPLNHSPNHFPSHSPNQITFKRTSKGIFKRTSNGHFVHMICALLNKSVSFENLIYKDPVSLSSLRSLPGTCSLCKRKGRFLIKCSYSGCKELYHGSCASKELYCDLNNQLVYCNEHLERGIYSIRSFLERKSRYGCLENEIFLVCCSEKGGEKGEYEKGMCKEKGECEEKGECKGKGKCEGRGECCKGKGMCKEMGEKCKERMCKEKGMCKESGETNSKSKFQRILEEELVSEKEFQEVFREVLFSQGHEQEQERMLFSQEPEELSKNKQEKELSKNKQEKELSKNKQEQEKQEQLSKNKQNLLELSKNKQEQNSLEIFSYWKEKRKRNFVNFKFQNYLNGRV